jgi:hypothetical protein
MWKGRWVGSDEAGDDRQGRDSPLDGRSGTSDVSPDGQRFLLLKPASEPTAPLPQLVVVQHSDEQLKRLVPVNSSRRPT